MASCRSKEGPPLLEAAFCHGFYEDIHIVAVVHVFVGEDNAGKVGRLKTLLRFSYLHNGPRSGVYVEVRFFDS